VWWRGEEIAGHGAWSREKNYLGTEYYFEKEQSIMTPKLQGALQALKVLQHDVETDAEEVITKVTALQARRQAAKTKTHTALDSAGSSLGDIEQFVEGLEGTNGAPNSSGGSDATSAPRSSDVAKQ